ncbi:TPA: radical SAM protein [Candidatus Bathyarchaeota archaeon]|nr:radical SAM protein [Candidatus Bathyarchaeota archaeon]
MKKLTKAIKYGMNILKHRPKGSYSFFLDALSYFSRSNRILGMPVNITIEPTNVCNQRCPVCETGAGILGRKKEFMSLENFKGIIDQVVPWTNSLIFYFMGEPFLNKEAYEMISYAKSKDIFITTCTNGQFVDPKKVLESGLDEISFQIGGMSQATHERYRVGGNLKQTLDNLNELIRLKKESQNTHLKVIMGFIVMKHNEHEVIKFRHWANEVGVDDAQVISPCVRNYQQGLEFLPEDDRYWFYDRQAFEREKILRPKIMLKNNCSWIYFSTTIQVNGDVVPCCRDPNGKYVMGNVLEEKLEDIWNNNRYVSFRQQLHKDIRKISICRLCSSFGVPRLH